MKFDEQKHYSIPLKYKSGKYKLAEFENAENKDGEQMFLTYYGWNGLVYKIPKYDINVDNSFYNLSFEEFECTFTVLYDNNEVLRLAETERSGRKLLVYIRFDSQSEAEKAILECAKSSAENIINQLTKYKQISRLFMDYYSDNNTLIIKTAVPQEVAKVEIYKDSSGEYSSENYITWNDTINIMIQCCEDSRVFYSAVELVKQYIQKNLDRLDKSEDFKFITEEYD